jgi:putative hydrolase of HD superfamily
MAVQAAASTGLEQTLASVSPRLSDQIRFLMEIDRLKQVVRANRISGDSRCENTAEHSWHVAMLGLVLAEHANEPVDVNRVMMLLLVHDIIEIDADDTPLYDEVGRLDKRLREEKAADRLFALLPNDQAQYFRRLWDEYEDNLTPEAKMAHAADRLLPILLNHAVGGGSWNNASVDLAREVSLTSSIDNGSAVLWELTTKVLDDAVGKGFLRP